MRIEETSMADIRRGDGEGTAEAELILGERLNPDKLVREIAFVLGVGEAGMIVSRALKMACVSLLMVHRSSTTRTASWSSWG